MLFVTLAVSGGYPTAIRAGKEISDPPPAAALSAPARKPAAASRTIVSTLRSNATLRGRAAPRGLGLQGGATTRRVRGGPPARASALPSLDGSDRPWSRPRAGPSWRIAGRPRRGEHRALGRPRTYRGPF